MTIQDFLNASDATAINDFVNRIRKAQDTILNGETDKNASLSMWTGFESGRPFVTVFAHGISGGAHVSESARIWPGFLPAEQTEEELAKCSGVIGYEI